MSETTAATKTGEQILTDAIAKAHGETHPHASALDITAILGIVSVIIEFIKGCRNQATAESHIKRGSATAYGSALKALRHAGYKGDKRAMAHRLTLEGKELSPAEMQAILSESEDVPQPPSPSGPWPLALLLALLFGCSTAIASPWPMLTSVSLTQSNVWPTAEIDRLHERLTRIEATLEEQGDSLALLETAIGKQTVMLKQLTEPKPAAAPVAKDAARTDICRCGGSNKAACFCLKTGQPCKCSPTKGSEWELRADGSPIKKTGNYANPQTQPAVPTKRAAVAGVAPVVVYQQQCVNGQCYAQGRRGLFGWAKR
jgi:hypothetical protein